MCDIGVSVCTSSHLIKLFVTVEQAEQAQNVRGRRATSMEVRPVTNINGGKLIHNVTTVPLAVLSRRGRQREESRTQKNLIGLPNQT